MLNARRFWSRGWREAAGGRRCYGRVVLPVMRPPDVQPGATEWCSDFHTTDERNGRDHGGWLRRMCRPCAGAGSPPPPSLVATLGYRGAMRAPEDGDGADAPAGVRLYVPRMMPAQKVYRATTCVRTFWFHTHWTEAQRAELRRTFDACRWIHNAVLAVWRGTGVHHSASGVYNSWLCTMGAAPTVDPETGRMVPAPVPLVRRRRQGRQRGSRRRPGRRGRGRRGGRHRPARRRRPRMPAPWRPGSCGATIRGALERRLADLYETVRRLRRANPPDKAAIKAEEARIVELRKDPALRAERLALMHRFPRPPLWTQSINAHIRREAVNQALQNIAQTDQKARRDAWSAEQRQARWDALTPAQRQGRRPPRGPRTFRMHQQQLAARFTPTETLHLQKAQAGDPGPILGFGDWSDGGDPRSAAMYLGKNFEKLGAVRVRGPRELIGRLLVPWFPKRRKKKKEEEATDATTEQAPDDEGGGETTGNEDPKDGAVGKRKRASGTGAGRKRLKNNTGAVVETCPDVPGTDGGEPGAPSVGPPPLVKARLRYAALLHWDKRRRAVRLGVQFEDPVHVSHADAMTVHRDADVKPDRVVGLDPGVRAVQTFCATDGTHGELMADLLDGRAGDPDRVDALRASLRTARGALTPADRALETALSIARAERRAAVRPEIDETAYPPPASSIPVVDRPMTCGDRRVPSAGVDGTLVPRIPGGRRVV